MNFDAQDDEVELSNEDMGFYENEDELSVSEVEDSTGGVPLCLKKFGIPQRPRSSLMLKMVRRRGPVSIAMAHHCKRIVSKTQDTVS